jgi:hypothetical protein
MSDEVRLKLKKIGSLQKEVILWLGKKQGVISIEDLKKRWPSTETEYEPSVQERMISAIVAAQGISKTISTSYAPYLKEEYFQEEKLFPLKGDWVEWYPEEFLGHKPSAMESSSLSKGIRGLEERKLLETAKIYGKRRRISHVKLTFHGEVASVLLRRRQTQEKN